MQKLISLFILQENTLFSLIIYLLVLSFLHNFKSLELKAQELSVQLEQSAREREGERATFW